jgi:elongation factor P
MGLENAQRAKSLARRSAMSYADALNLRKGWFIKYEGELWRVVDYQHLTPGNWRGYMQTKLKNVRTGAISENRFRSHDKVEIADLDNRNLQYLYKQDREFHFMDVQTYDQYALVDEDLGDAVGYLKEGITVQVQFWEDRAVGVMLPTMVDLKITYTEPGFKGNTASNTTKPATMETGLVIQVPLFVETGETIKIDTRTNVYLERVKV